MYSFIDKNGLIYFLAKIKEIFVKKEDGKGLSENDFTSSYKTKLDGVEAGAEANQINSILVNGEVSTPSEKSVSLTIPVKVSELTNDIKFQTDAEVKNAITEATKNITGVNFEVVETLPSTGSAGVIYLVSNGKSGESKYKEYVYLSSSASFEELGDTDIDLSGYVKKTDITAVTNEEIDGIFTA